MTDPTNPRRLSNQPDGDRPTLDILHHIRALAVSSVHCAKGHLDVLVSANDAFNAAKASRHDVRAAAEAARATAEATRAAAKATSTDVRVAAELLAVADWLRDNPSLRARLQAAVDRVDRDHLWWAMDDLPLPLNVFSTWAEDNFEQLSLGCKMFVDKLIELLDNPVERS